MQDPVHTVVLKDYVQSQVGTIYILMDRCLSIFVTGVFLHIFVNCHPCSARPLNASILPVELAYSFQDRPRALISLSMRVVNISICCVQVTLMAQQLGENYKEIIMNVDVETRDNLLEFVTL